VVCPLMAAAATLDAPSAKMAAPHAALSARCQVSGGRGAAMPMSVRVTGVTGRSARRRVRDPR
jgi:hypothetical protein